METFDTIAKACASNDIPLYDEFFQSYMNYVEKMFEKDHPQVHEYKQLERNIFRIQQFTSDLTRQLDFEKRTRSTILRFLGFTNELISVNYNENLISSRRTILDYLQSIGSKLTGTFLRQAPGDESLFDHTLDALLSEGYQELPVVLLNSVLENQMFYSTERIVQAKAYLLPNQDEHQLFESVEDILQQDSSGVDASKVYLKLIHIFVTSGRVSPNGVFVTELTTKFNNEGIETPLEAYKICIDAAIKNNDMATSSTIFEQSINSYVQWWDGTGPKVLRTLNDLIILACKNMNDIEDLFLFFSKIKQQMTDRPINIYAITELSRRMLQVEYVGDCIEMLKRELPSIKKDDNIKIEVSQPYAAAYRQLFDLLHEFAISYTNEETFETNWVLYGELHKFFHVPYESYFPAIKFFSERGRLNASLIIFRQIRNLYETHGNHNNLPPSKEMYVYLFEEFGDKLYQEGVEEIHEYLKTDVSLPRQDLELQNSLLQAYSNLQEVGKTRDLFLAMNPMKKIEGKSTINEETVQIMLKTFTYSNLNHVKLFWNNLSRFGILPNDAIFRQYLIAYVYHGFPEEATSLTEEMDDYGLEVTEDTVVSLYNFCLSSEDQDKIEEWAHAHYKELWQSAVDKKLLTRSNNYLPESSLLLENVTAAVSK
ncbi:hypothetical protein CANTEDRAFT_116822 [Yamadazyma tenuis ATCC 10573]|nr:uncharacterized protein CANTEDRAFT_116822 [Yamadazyma tenuis ATCC 10573]EGV60755.1 hypothetical protein CANTEDRAFT_116822 [Yamadazyma tenuis ATCC 10573]